MRCPNCTQRPLSFGQTFRVNPFRLTCTHCQARLRAGSLLYLWTAFHLVIGLGLGLVRTAAWIDARGILDLPADWPWFVVGVLIVVFVTANVVPWVFFQSAYQRAE